MEKIDYSLAPAGATHEYHGMWRKAAGNGKWFFWSGVKWDVSLPEHSNSYTPIPEREIDKNALADAYLWDGVSFEIEFTHMQMVNAWKFTESELRDRRAARIEAGLIKENNDLADVNDTDAVEMEWINGLPPVGCICEVAASTEYLKINHEEGRVVKIYSNFTDDFGCELAAFVSVDHPKIGGVMTSKCFRPLKTAEQIAAEKKKEWKHKLMDKLAFHISPESTAENHIDLAASIVYDALLSGELKAPKGDL